MVETKKLGMGWLPDYPDLRDYTAEHNTVVKAMLGKVGLAQAVTLPSSIDLRQWCSPIEHQGELGSCTAHTGVGLVEYFERRAFGKHIDASRLFLYKVTRNMLHWTGDTGAFLRSVMGALRLFGVPPEEYWPYATADFDKEPPAFCYAFAQNYQAIKYYRLDPPGTMSNVLLDSIRRHLAVGLPSMFGFTVYSSISQASTTGKIPFPTAGEKTLGGHAVAAVGYDDSVGALLIRNSWGPEWGKTGYGWLPYDYVLKGLAIDWWSLLKSEWVDTGQFKL